MIKPKVCMIICAGTILCSACAATTFTQKGQITDESICYDKTCYTTIKWQDGSYSNIEKDLLPDTDVVYRHCYIDDSGETICRPTVYKVPIRLFNKSRDDAELQQ